MAVGKTGPNLTDFMSGVRVSLWVTGGALGLFILGQVVVNIAASLMPETVEVNLPVPNYAFGALPPIEFAYDSETVRPSQFVVEVDGVEVDGEINWPVFGERGAAAQMIEVYELEPLLATLTSEQKARDIATNLGFYDEPNSSNPNSYVFSYEGEALDEALEVNLETMFVTLLTNYLNTEGVFAPRDALGNTQVPDRTSAIEAVQFYLETAGILPPDLNLAQTNVEYRKKVGNRLGPVEDFAEAEYTSVSIPRSPLPGWRDGEPTNYGFYGPDNMASIYGVVGKTNDNQNVVVALNDYYYALDTGVEGSYYLRSVGEAYEALQLGEGYIINPYGAQKAVINQVLLGYYESHQEQEYLLPIYVFLGENGFMAYVQALHPSMLRGASTGEN